MQHNMDGDAKVRQKENFKELQLDTGQTLFWILGSAKHDQG